MNDVALYKVKALVDVAQKIVDAYSGVAFVDGPRGEGLKEAYDIVMKDARLIMDPIARERDSE